MSLPARVEPILPLVETLVGCQDPLLRDRVLLQAAFTCSRAHAIALWRPAPTPAGDDAWRPVLTLGDPAGLPQPGEVQAVLEGTLEAELGDERHVLACPEGPQAWALSIHGPHDEEGLALIEALFALARTLEPAIDPIQAPLPSQPRNDSPSEADLASDSESNELRHDLRNLLTTVRSAFDYVELFRDELDAEETSRVDDVLERDLDRIGRLFAEALDGPAGAAGPWSPEELVLDLHESLKPEFAAVQRSLEVTCAEGLEAPDELTEIDAWRILDNLVRNALEAMISNERPGGVALSWTRTGDSIVLSIEDDGPGLPPASGELFERGFTRGKPTGSGLGLSIVRDLVEGSGGRIEASSRPTGGASFRLTWPLTGPDGTIGR